MAISGHRSRGSIGHWLMDMDFGLNARERDMARSQTLKQWLMRGGRMTEAVADAHVRSARIRLRGPKGTVMINNKSVPIRRKGTHLMYDPPKRQR